ncbi:hypothetical protein BASA81_014018 [Batrachochytrium salamandrivorans]|nr:hypothetical protein BASA81_014018 [Batrachochytrium salamandrivorans]
MDSPKRDDHDDDESFSVKKVTFTKSSSQSGFTQAVFLETLTPKVSALPNSQHAPPCTPQHSTQADDTGDTQTQDAEENDTQTQEAEEEDDVLLFKPGQATSSVPPLSPKPAPVSKPSPPPPKLPRVSQCENYIRTRVRFCPSDFIFYEKTGKNADFCPMVRITNFNILSVQAQDSLLKDKKRYFINGSENLVDNLYLRVTPMGEEFDMWLVTDSVRKPFTLDRTKWPNKAKKAIERTQPASKLHKALLEAEKMYRLALEFESKQEQEEERSKQLVPTMPFKEDEEEEAPPVASNNQHHHEVLHIAFKIDMQLWVQSHLQPQARRRILEIKPNGDMVPEYLIRLDNDHWLVNSDLVALEPQWMVRYKDLLAEGGSTFEVGMSTRESQVTESMHIHKQAQQRMSSAIQQEFPDFAEIRLAGGGEDGK